MLSAQGICPLATVLREQLTLLASLADSRVLTEDAVPLGSSPLIRNC